MIGVRVKKLFFSLMIAFILHSGQIFAVSNQTEGLESPSVFVSSHNVKKLIFKIDSGRMQEMVKNYWELDDLWLESFLESIPKDEVWEATGTYMKPSKGRISSPYSKTRQHPVFGTVRPHGGTDIAGVHGEPIWAADGGMVVYADQMLGYGNIVILNHGKGRTTFYAHQQKILVKVGQAVRKGDLIGLVGSTGVSTGPHLHFEIRQGIENLDPYHFIPYKD